MKPSPTFWGQLRRPVFIGLFVFAVIFIAFGGFMASRVIKHLRRWAEVRHWVETPCRLLSVSLEAHEETERVVAKYAYRCAGLPYHGRRVWLTENADSIGGFHRRTYHRLEQHRQQGLPYRCFVDPHDPIRSILERQLRVEVLLFYIGPMICFGGLGLGLLICLILVCRFFWGLTTAQALRPNEPWTWDERSVDGQFPAATEWPMLLVFGLCWIAMCLPMVHSACSDLPMPVALLPLVIPMIGVGFVFFSWSGGRTYDRFGPPKLAIEPWPYYVGDELRGTISFAGAAPTGKTVTVELKVRTDRGEDGDLVHFESSQQIPCGPTLVFTFAPPSSTPNSSLYYDTGHPVNWSVTVTGPDRRRQLNLLYHIAAYRRSAEK